jgi:hypothetical protein
MGNQAKHVPRGEPGLFRNPDGGNGPVQQRLAQG